MPEYSSIFSVLSEQALHKPEHIFIEDRDVSLTYAEVRRYVETLACFLLEHSVKPGKKVGVILENSVEFLLLWLAIERIGAVLVPINPALNSDEVSFILKHSESFLCVTTDLRAKKLAHNGVSTPFLFSSALLPRHIKQMKRCVLPETAREGDIAAILYTSGTTGKPKGVILPHRSFVIGGQSFACRAGLTEHDRVMVMLPLFHVNALIYSTMGCMTAGGTLVVQDRFHASSFWKTVSEKKITEFNFLGVVANILLRQKKSSDETAHRVRVAFGAGLSKETIVAFEKRFGIPLIETYGLTECPMGTSNLLSDRKLGSIGKPSRHPDPDVFTSLRIVDDKGNDVASGEVGEIILKSPVLALGYYKNPEETKKVFKDRWFFTGDMGYQDRSGFVYFVDRKKDIIRKRGENISSREIEKAILTLPGVVECAVVPVPAALGEDDIKAVIVRKPGTALSPVQVKEYCRQHLAPFKVPAIVAFVDAIPKTPTQKISKKSIVYTKGKKPMRNSSVFVFDGIRTPIGKFFGALKDVRPDDMLSMCLTHIVKKHDLPFVDDVIVGCVNQSGEDSRNVARQAVLLSSLQNGVSVETPAATVTRLSASGLEAVRVGMQEILSGQSTIVLSGGVESFSRAPFILPRKDKEHAQGGHPIDSKLGWRFLHPKLQGILKENAASVEELVKTMKISRGEQDEYAALSNERAVASRRNPVFSKDFLKMRELARDEVPRDDITKERLAVLSPLYDRSGMITAGNASKLGDGAAAILLGSDRSKEYIREKPLAELISVAVVGTKPEEYGIAPVFAVRKLLNDAELTLDHVGVIELHEAYAGQVLACMKLMRVKHDRINAFGGAIALGHPFGMSGTRLLLTVCRQLQEKKDEFGVVAMCIGGGQGMAMLLKRTE